MGRPPRGLRGQRGGRSPAATRPKRTDSEWEFRLSHRIPIGVKDGPAPVIHDIDWNPMPDKLKGASALNVLACVSSFGTQIFKRDKSTKKWKRVRIIGCPTREGFSVKWHIKGKVLATACGPKEDEHENLSILTYDTNFMRFNTAKAYECDEGVRISSLVWSYDGRYLAASLKPLSQICFFKFDNNKEPQELRNLGSTRCSNFPTGASIVLKAHPILEFIISCAQEADHIVIWKHTKDPEITVEWQVWQRIHCGQGVRSMALAVGDFDDTLITLETNSSWRQWNFRSAANTMLQEEWRAVREHNRVHGRANHFLSNLNCLDISKSGKLIASGGTLDTLLLHIRGRKNSIELWKLVGYKKKNICYRLPKCLKFNLKEDIGMRVAMGGVSGYIHLWAVYDKASATVTIRDIERTSEHDVFYNKYQSLEDIDVDDITFDGASDIEEELEKYKSNEIDDDDIADVEEEEEGDIADMEEVEEAGGSVEVKKTGGSSTMGKETGASSKEVTSEAAVGSAAEEAGKSAEEDPFDDIANEAVLISRQIDSQEDVSQDRMKAFCQRILQYDKDRKK